MGDGGVSGRAVLTLRMGERGPTSPSTGGRTDVSPSTARVTTAVMSFVSVAASVALNSAMLYLSQKDIWDWTEASESAASRQTRRREENDMATERRQKRRERC